MLISTQRQGAEIGKVWKRRSGGGSDEAAGGPETRGEGMEDWMWTCWNFCMILWTSSV